MISINTIIQAIKFVFRSQTVNRIQNNFLTTMAYEVLNNDKTFYVFPEIEAQRKKLKNNNNKIEFVEMGAGSKKMKIDFRKISSIAKSSLSSPWQCQIMFGLINYYKKTNILEIGTSLGISTAYLAKANTNSQIITLEGNPRCIDIARGVFQSLNIKNINCVEGNFDITLDNILEKRHLIDFAFIDGNHTYHKTISYFEKILKKSKNDAILIIDDIYWSAEMTKAWNEIKRHKKIKLTIDLFYFGIVLLDDNLIINGTKHYSIIHPKYKPWQKLLASVLL